MKTLNPMSLTYSELLKYAQMFLDRKESLPITWQQELITRALAKQV